MTPDQQPATKHDLAELETTVKQDLAELKTTVKQDVAELEAKVKQNLAELEAKVKQNLAELEIRIGDKLTESMRDMQSEILRGLERFARGNFAHLHRLDTADVTTNERLTALEERVIALETRPPR